MGQWIDIVFEFEKNKFTEEVSRKLVTDLFNAHLPNARKERMEEISNIDDYFKKNAMSLYNTGRLANSLFFPDGSGSGFGITSSKQLLNLDKSLLLISISVPDGLFRVDHEYAERDPEYGYLYTKEGVMESFDEFINDAKIIYDAVSPTVGYGTTEIMETFKEMSQEVKNFSLAKHINSIANINFLCPKKVEEIGREKLLSAPAWKIEELSDGGILLIVDAPDDELDEEYDKYIIKSRYAHLLKHLGFKKTYWECLK